MDEVVPPLPPAGATVGATRSSYACFLKSNVRELKRGRPSLMPSYETVLGKKEIEDLVAYLSSLRGAR